MAFGNVPGFAFGGVPRVNLMPRAEIERRERGVLLRRWGWGLVVALLAVVVLSAAAFWLQSTAAQRLADENGKTSALLSQVAGLQPVRAKLDLEAELGTFRSEAMGVDLTWSILTSTVAQALPEGVTVAGFSLVPGNNPIGEDPALEVGASGSFTLLSDSPIGIVSFVRSVREIPGILSAEAWELSSDAAGYSYLVTVAFDQSVYTGDYAEEAGE